MFKAVSNVLSILYQASVFKNDVNSNLTQENFILKAAAGKMIEQF